MTMLAMRPGKACAAVVYSALRPSFQSAVTASAARQLRHQLRQRSSLSRLNTASLRAAAGVATGRRDASGAAGPPISTNSRRTFATALAVGLVAGYGISVLYPPGWYRLLYPAPASVHPAADTPAGVAHARSIEDQLQNLDLVKQLRSEVIDPATGTISRTSPNETSLSGEQTSRVRRWKETRPFERLPEYKKRHSLTQFSLRGPGKFAVNPLVFSTLDNKETVALVHVGSGMCGHNGIVHGGLLATLLDEAVARPAFFALPNKIGMTVYLNVRYKAPTPADQFLVVKTRLKSASGRKAFVEGEIYDLKGARLVECDGLYVEPKDAWILKTSAVKEALAEA